LFPVLHAVPAVAAIRVAIAIVLTTLAFPVAGLAQTVLFESDFEAPIYTPIPEPGTGVLAMVGLGILAASKRRGAGRQAGAGGGGR
jgi:PEP-CTERM motif